MGNPSKAARGWIGVTAALLMLGACTSDPGDPGASGDGRRFDGPILGISSSAPTVLRSAGSCDDVIEGLRSLATENAAAGGFAIGGRTVFGDGDAMATAEVAADAGTALSPTAAGQGSGGSSDTNTQEAGIDEPDVVETDGTHVYVIDHGNGDSERLVILDGATAQVLSRVDLGSWGNQMLLSGDRLLVISSGGYGMYPGGGVVVDDVAESAPAEPAPAPGDEPAPDPDPDVEPVPLPEPVDPPMPTEPPGFNVGSTLQLFDVTDPAAPQLVESTEVEGSHTSTRVVDGVARIVISSYPEIHPVAENIDFDDADAVREATEEAIGEAELSDWLPSYRTTSPDGTDGVTSTEGEAVACDQVLMPDVNAGTGETSILRVDFDTGFDPSATTTVVADAHTVYASAQTLYIGATSYVVPGRGVGAEPGADPSADDWSTAIHAFDLTGDGAAAHLAAGEVPGSLLNQYSMSEFGGDLRVATTEGTPWGDTTDSESAVRVLRRTGDQLAEIGVVGGLGVTETIRSVRFMGDVGYVVTFRQTDPLYVIDLSDPTAPKAVGELKIPGFSSYLHPTADGRLVGLGRDADEETGQDRGFLLSLFDVSDHSAPAQLQTFTDPAIHSEAGWDSKAFLWWAPENAVVVPYERYDESSLTEPSDGEEYVEPEYDTGLLVFDVSDGGITLRGSISTTSGGESGSYTWWSRGLVVQDRLWGLYSQSGSDGTSVGGVAVTEFGALGSPVFVPFG